jgi:hypothetical protein
MFPVYGEKCLSHKAVHNWVEKFSQGRSKVADYARQGAEVAETTDKKTSILRVSTHWYCGGSSVTVLLDDISRNRCIFFRLEYMFYIHFLPIY